MATWQFIKEQNNSQQQHMKTAIVLTTAFAVAGITASAATSFTEGFSAATITSKLIAPSEFVFGPNAFPVGAAQNPSGTRRYVTTAATDFNTVDFIFEITYTVNTPTAAQTPIVGFGSGAGDPNFFFEPHTSIYLRQFPDDFESGQLRLTVSSGPQIPPNQPPEFVISGTPGPGNGTHRVRITKVGDVITLAEDENYTGGEFTPDYSVSRSLATDLPFLNSTNSRLFFGVQSGNTTFDNLSVVVEPELQIWPAVELGWFASTGRVYQLQYTTAVPTTQWFNFGPPIVGNESSNFVFDSTRHGMKRFYRLVSTNQ